MHTQSVGWVLWTQQEKYPEMSTQEGATQYQRVEAAARTVANLLGLKEYPFAQICGFADEEARRAGVLLTESFWPMWEGHKDPVVESIARRALVISIAKKSGE